MKPTARLEISKADLDWAVHEVAEAFSKWDSSLESPLRGWSAGGLLWVALQSRMATPKRPEAPVRYDPEKSAAPASRVTQKPRPTPRARPNRPAA